VQLADRLASIPPYPFGQIAALKRQAVAEGWDIIDFGIGDPDLPAPDCVVDALREAVGDPSVHRYDESAWGEEAFLDAIREWFAGRFGVALRGDGDIKVTVGSKEALAHTAWAFINPGDIALVPTPGYGVYAFNTTMAGGEVHGLPLSRETGFLPDLDSVPSGVANRAKLLFLNYPNNPTGACAPPGFYGRAVEFCEKYDILLCSDAAYSELYFGSSAPRSVLEAPGAMGRCVEFHSCSKPYCMTGWRVGWVCGQPDAVKGISTMKSYVDSNVFAAIQRAAAVALRDGAAHAEMVRRVYRGRRDALVSGLRGLGWPVDAPEGTFYVWAPTPAGMSSAELAARLLEQAYVVSIPGASYGAAGEGFVRFSLTLTAEDPIARIGDAVERIGKLGLAW
jgi:LL-diaminopimelate aminotransferase